MKHKHRWHLNPFFSETIVHIGGKKDFRLQFVCDCGASKIVDVKKDKRN